MNKDKLTEYADMLMAVAVSKCDNLEDAKDLVQEGRSIESQPSALMKSVKYLMKARSMMDPMMRRISDVVLQLLRVFIVKSW